MKSEENEEDLLIFLGIIIGSIWKIMISTLKMNPISSFAIIFIVVILVYYIYIKLR